MTVQWGRPKEEESRINLRLVGRGLGEGIPRSGTLAEQRGRCSPRTRKSPGLGHNETRGGIKKKVNRGEVSLLYTSSDKGKIRREKRRERLD